MSNPNDYYEDDLDELLSQVDALLMPEKPAGQEDEEDFDLEEYAPADTEDDDLLVFQNYSNRYGADVRNYSNGYGSGAPMEENRQPVKPSIPAYNADYRRPEREKPRNPETRSSRPAENPHRAAPKQEHTPEPRKPKKRPSCCGCGCSVMIGGAVAMVLAVMLVFNWIFAVPTSADSIGSRKRDTAAVLICGTDWEGARTDTMMLLYMSGSDKQVNLLSLPRDTYTITSSGNGAKLNSAYGRNGSGAEGMEGLLDYVQEIIGYRPDGYVLVDMDMVPRMVDLMGGLDVEVPMTFDLGGEHLDAGMQHLNGDQVLQLLRYRKGYSMQDLDRVKVQRSVIKAALEQWVSLSHIGDVAAALELVQENSLSSLSVNNYLWMAKTVLLNMGNLESHTLPGYATYIGDVSYYVLYRQDVADLVNQFYNPYQEEILAENLKIAG